MPVFAGRGGRRYRVRCAAPSRRPVSRALAWIRWVRQASGPVHRAAGRTRGGGSTGRGYGTVLWWMQVRLAEYAVARNFERLFYTELHGCDQGRPDFPVSRGGRMPSMPIAAGMMMRGDGDTMGALEAAVFAEHGVLGFDPGPIVEDPAAGESERPSARSWGRRAADDICAS